MFGIAAMNYFVFTGTLSLTLIAILARACLQSYRAKPSMSLCWAAILMSLVFLGITTVRFTPRPFISFHQNILPVVGCLVAMLVSIRAFAGASIPRRLGLILTVLASLTVTSLAVAEVWSDWARPHSRGALFGW